MFTAIQLQSKITYILLQINNIELRSDGCGGFLRHPDAHVVWFALERGSTSSCKDLRSFCDSYEVCGTCYCYRVTDPNDKNPPIDLDLGSSVFLPGHGH